MQPMRRGSATLSDQGRLNSSYSIWIPEHFCFKPQASKPLESVIALHFANLARQGYMFILYHIISLSVYYLFSLYIYIYIYVCV